MVNVFDGLFQSHRDKQPMTIVAIWEKFAPAVGGRDEVDERRAWRWVPRMQGGSCGVGLGGEFGLRRSGDLRVRQSLLPNYL